MMLFKDTLPVFGLCDSNMLVNSFIANTVAKDEILSVNDRTVFEYNFLKTNNGATIAESMQGHFLRLCIYKHKFSKAVLGEIKKKWKDGTLIPDMVNQTIDGQFMPTDNINWTVNFPDKIEFVTRTVEDELCLTGWIWGCSCLYEVCMKALAIFPNVDIKESKAQDKDNDDSDYLPHEVMYKAANDTDRQKYTDMLREAASVFNYMTLRGYKEGFAKFDRNMPIFLKAYVCFAYQKLCEALSYVIQANSLLKESIGDSMSAEAAECLMRAHLIIESGYQVLKNGNGADDPGLYLSYAYNYIRVTIFVYYKFYSARFSAIDDNKRKLAYTYMSMALEFPHLTSGNKDKMKAMLDSIGSLNEQLESDGFVSKLIGGVKKLVMFERSHAFENINSAMADINKLEPLPQIKYDASEVKDFKIVSADKFIFSFLKFMDK